MHLVRTIAELTCKGYDFSNDQFRDTSRVGERRVEDADTSPSSVVEINLVGADAEAADDKQVFGFPQDSLRQLGL